MNERWGTDPFPPDADDYADPTEIEPDEALDLATHGDAPYGVDPFEIVAAMEEAALAA